MLSFIAERASEQAPALVRPGGEAMSYGSLALASSALMQALGARVGDVRQRLVGIAVDDSAGFVASVLAVLESGGIAMPLDLRRGLPALELEAARARAVAVIVGDAVADRLEIVAGDASRRALPADLCLALEASGRRALWSRVALGVGVDAIGAQLGIGPASRVPLVGPLGHGAVLVGQALATLRAGGALLLVDALAPEEQGAAMARLGADVIAALPSTLRALARVGTAGLRARSVVAVGELAPGDLTLFAASFGEARLGRACDRAEALRVAARFADEPGFAAGQLGPLPGVVCAIDPAGKLQLRSPSLMSGYLDDPEATAHALREQDGAPWWHGGDGAQLFPDGSLVIDAGADGNITIDDERVDLAVVERGLRHTPGIREAALLAVRDAAGPRLYAFVSGDAASAPRHPARVVTLESLPRTADGEIDREALRRMASAE